MEIKLQQRLNKPSTWRDVAEVIFSNAKIFNVPYMSTEFTSQTGTRGTAYGFSDFTLTNDTLDVATKKVVPVFVDHADMAQTTFLGQMDIAERQGQILNVDIETTMLADHGNWTDVGDVAGVITSGNSTTITVSASNVDDITRGIRRIINVADGMQLAAARGIFIVWRSADFEFLEAYAQANGFNLADAALKTGIDSGFFFLGVHHYISNSHAANHLFAGVRKIFKIGILRDTWGKIFINPDPNEQSGVGLVARADYGILAPAGLTTILLDINVS